MNISKSKKNKFNLHDQYLRNTFFCSKFILIVEIGKKITITFNVKYFIFQVK